MNQVLKMFQRNQGYSFYEFEKYLKEHRKKTGIEVEAPNILEYVEIYGKRHFIKLVEII